MRKNTIASKNESILLEYLKNLIVTSKQVVVVDVNSLAHLDMAGWAQHRCCMVLTQPHFFVNNHIQELSF